MFYFIWKLKCTMVNSSPVVIIVTERQDGLKSLYQTHHMRESRDVNFSC